MNLNSRSSLSTKLFISQAVVAILIAAVALFGINAYISNRTRSQADTLSNHIVSEIHGALESTNDLSLQNVHTSMNILNSFRRSKGAASIGGAVRLGDKVVPSLLIGGEPQTRNYAIVDRVKTITNSTATLFVKSGDEYVRVSTNVFKDGRRAIGTILDKKGKAIKAIESDKSYYGLVTILGKPYITGYEPLRDKTGKTIGISYVGYPLNTFESLSKSIAGTKILDNGFVAILDSQGEPQFKSSHVGSSLIKSVLSDSKTASAWTVRRRSFEPWGYSLVAAYPKSDIAAQLRPLRISSLFLSILGALLLFATNYFVTHKLLTKPLSLLGKASERLAAGEAVENLDCNQNDELGAVIESFNHMSRNIREQAHAAELIAAGNLDVEISPRSDKDVLGQAMANMARTLSALVSETRELNEAAKMGRLDKRGDPDKYQGAFREVVAGMNETLEGIAGPLKLTAQYLDKISRGDIPEAITQEFNGEIEDIKNSLNRCIEAVGLLVSDANQLATSAIAGRYETRADISKHQGDFALVVEGVNKTLDNIVDKVFWYEQLLDSIPFPVSVTDSEMNWTFVNKPVEDFLGVRRQDIIGKQCSNWNANICKTENCGINRLRKGEGRTEFSQSGLRFQVDTSYIRNKDGQPIGHIEVVQDISAQSAVTEFQKVEVQRLAQNLRRLAHGDIDLDFELSEPNEYTREVHRDFQTINTSLLEARDAIAALVADAEMLSRAAARGELSARAEADRHSGHYKAIVDGINETLNHVITPLNTAADFIDKLGNGETPEEVTGSFEGDFNTLICSLNRILNTVKMRSEDVSLLINSLTKGQLDVRADTAKYSGYNAALIEGMNRMIDAVTAPISEASKVFERLAHNDLSVSMSEDYEGEFGRLASNLNKAVGSLGNTVKRVMESANHVAQSASDLRLTAIEATRATQQIAEAIEHVATGASEESDMMETTIKAIESLVAAIEELTNSTATQTEQVMQAVSAVSEIGNGISMIAETAKRSSTASEEVAHVAETGRFSVVEAVEGIHRIAAATSNAANAIEQLGQTSKTIGVIVEAINDIAEQTNLLALNAAIEAARAGEHGKGFAVVADEVRKLAERAAGETKKIDALISEIQANTEDAVVAMESGSKEVKSGVELANKAGEALEQIKQAVDEVVQQSLGVYSAAETINECSQDVEKLMREVAGIAQQTGSAADEMALNGQTVSANIFKVQTISEQNAATAQEVSAATEEQNAAIEELSASSDELNDISASLKDIVATFKIKADSDSDRPEVSDLAA